MLANNALIADFRTRLSEYPFALQVPQVLRTEDLFAAKSKGGTNAWHPQQESNPYQQYRKLLFYPLNYGGV